MALIGCGRQMAPDRADYLSQQVALVDVTCHIMFVCP